MSNIFLKTYTELKRNSLFAVSAVMIPVLVLIVYWQDVSLLVNEALYNEAMTHVLVVPVLFSYLVYRKRNMIKAAFALENIRQRSKDALVTEAVGLCLCLAALLIYWYGSYTFYTLEYHILSLPLFVAGIILILFNFKTLTVIIFPILFLLFFIPPPSEVTYTLGAVIGNFNTQASYLLLKTFGLPAIFDTTYGAPTIAVTDPSGTPMLFSVDLPCSGIYSLIAFVMFATFLAYIIRGSLLKKAGLFLFGFAVLQVLNILRITVIVAVGYWFGEEIAMTIFHAAAGWILIFGGIFLLLLIGEKVLHLQIFRATKELPFCPHCDDGTQKQEQFCSYCGKFFKNLTDSTRISGRFLVKIFALLVGLLIVASTMHAPVFAFAEGLTFTGSDFEESEVFPDFTDYQFRFLYRDVEYEVLADQDASLLYGYIPLNASASTVYVDIGVAESLTNLHNWEVCYVTYQTAQGQQPLVKVLDSRDIQIAVNPPLIARYFSFESPNNYSQISLYWYEKALFNTGITIEQKFVRITLIILAADSTDYLAHEETLLTFAESISAYWKPLKEQSLFSLSIFVQQALLIVTALFIVVTTATQYTRKWQKKTENLKIFEKTVSSSGKLLYQTLEELNEGAGATTHEIAHALEAATGKPSDLDELVKLLKHFRENGLAEVDIISVDDEPQLIWKPS